VAYFQANQPDLERTFDAFSIYRPVNDQEIPLEFGACNKGISLAL
jgi:hypothetical protein